MSIQHPPRSCPVCTESVKHRLFHQTFAALSDGSLLEGFDLVICDYCGAAYADNVPDQAAFDRYYAEMSKYEYASAGGQPSPSDRARFREIADLVQPHLHSDWLLLDVGCATGGLLAEFKTRGFTRLLGVDPAPACARLAAEINGIPARPLTIAELGQLSEKAEVVFLTGVLEHVRDVDDALRYVVGTMASNGLLYIEVPDASRYDRHFSAPYQLLSMEHVNYFSPTSLTTLMARHGFSAVFVTRTIRHLSAEAIEPCVSGLFLRARSALGARDEETRPALIRYLAQSAALEDRVHQKIAKLSASKIPLAVWGAGTHTLRLLMTSRLPEANLVAFIDSNVNYQGKRLAGRPVLAPAEFAGNPADILISSQVSESVIHQMITEKFGWPNRVHRLYGLPDS